MSVHLWIRAIVWFIVFAAASLGFGWVAYRYRQFRPLLAGWLAPLAASGVCALTGYSSLAIRLWQGSLAAVWCMFAFGLLTAPLGLPKRRLVRLLLLTGISGTFSAIGIPVRSALYDMGQIASGLAVVCLTMALMVASGFSIEWRRAQGDGPAGTEAAHDLTTGPL